MLKEPKNGYKRYYLSLTGENSHVIDLMISQGRLSIGTEGVSTGKYDVLVQPGQKINWDTFNGLFTHYGEQMKDEYPYGNWPRAITYSGMDMGFITWTSKRKTEDLYWTPTEDVTADLEKSMICRLKLVLDHKVKVTIGPGTQWLFLEGDPKNLEIRATGKEPILDFNMTGYTDPEKIYRIPDLKDLHGAESVYVRVSPLGDPFDCRSLLQFPGLKDLHISGYICNAGALSELKGLESLWFNTVPDLTDLPAADCWEHLDRFVGVDIDEATGKEIKKQLKALQKEREIDTHIAKLRSRTWFETEYINPFKDWEGKQGKKASGLYKDTLKEIAKAEDEAAVREHIISFTKAFNECDDIETGEREDIWDAVSRLVTASGFKISEDTYMNWFDEARDY